MTAILTPAMKAYSAWSLEKSKLGDPARRPHLTRDAFYAGWQAALEAHPECDARRPKLHEQVTLDSLETSEDDAVAITLRDFGAVA